MKWEVFYTESAWKDLDALTSKTARNVVLKIKYFAGQENPLNFAKKLKPPFEDLYRFRIGDYRAIFEIESKKKIRLLFILRIKHRKDVYR